MTIAAKTPAEYLAAVPPERRPHLDKLRALIRKSVPQATEGILWGMLGFTIEERLFAALASRKNYISLHLPDLYTQPRLREKHAAALSALKMGKGCINFKSADELPLATIAAILREAPHAVVAGGTMARAAQPGKKSAKRR